MVFKCQEDSFLKEFTSTVVSCDPATLSLPQSNKSEPPVTLRGFNVVCEDTILFPEGGGQPCDYGTFNDMPVRSVVRKDTEAIHFVETVQSFDIGSEVKQVLDWRRRLDHMQQHSGQHLITALIDREYKYNTSSWWLGSDICHIELNTYHMLTREALDKIETQANDLIRECRKVTVYTMDPEEAMMMDDARAPRGLPKNHKGPARVIQIEGIESNMCCGTHVTNLSQLQCIKLLYADNIKGIVYVQFVVGDRVVRKLGECFAREQQMNLALKGGPPQHLELIEKIQNNLKNTTKSMQQLLREVAVKEANKLENMKELPKYYILHRKNGLETEFMSNFLRNAPDNIFYFLTVSDVQKNGSNSKGQMVLHGDPKLIKEFGPMFLKVLDGKGNGKDNHFQGKFTKVNQIDICDTLIEEHFKSSESKVQNNEP